MKTNQPYPYSVQSVSDSFTGHNTIDPLRLFYGLFGEICSVYTYSGYTLNAKAFPLLHEKYSSSKFYRRFQCDSEDTIKQTLYGVILQEYLLIAVTQGTVTIYYLKDKSDNDMEELKNLICPYLIQNDKDDVPERLYMVIVEDHCFDLQAIQLSHAETDIHAFYNDDLLPVHHIIQDSLRNERSGLIILHGLYGTGKTSYIKHLIKNTPQRFIYVPGEMAEILSQPSFLPFLSRYPSSILILEDCEELLRQRQVSGNINPAIVNILNMTDGLLGDGLQLKFICTFNAPIKDIDKALLRKGRLIAKYDFGKLETDKVNRLIMRQNLDIPHVETPMSLADIFNYRERSFEQEHSKRLGFN